MKCNYCGFNNKDTSKFCANCGCNLKASKTGLSSLRFTTYSIIRGVLAGAITWFLVFYYMDNSSKKESSLILLGSILVYSLVNIISNIIIKQSNKIKYSDNICSYFFSYGSSILLGCFIYLFFSNDYLAPLSIIVFCIMAVPIVICITILSLIIDFLMGVTKIKGDKK